MNTLIQGSMGAWCVDKHVIRGYCSMYVYVCLHTTDTDKGIGIDTDIDIDMCTCIYICIHMYVYIYIHKSVYDVAHPCVLRSCLSLAGNDLVSLIPLH